MHITPAVQSPANRVPVATATDDPIEWFFFEERGTQWGDGGRWPQLTIELWPHNEGQDAIVTDGRMSYEHDPGTVEDRYYSYRQFLRDGIDPDRAAADAARGAAALSDAIERGVGEAAQWEVVPRGSRVPRLPDQLDVWIRRESGASQRFLVPVDKLPAGLRDARAAATAFARTVRHDYIAFSGAEQPTIA